jgi:hypothetical protein
LFWETYRGGVDDELEPTGILGRGGGGRTLLTLSGGLLTPVPAITINSIQHQCDFQETAGDYQQHSAHMRLQETAGDYQQHSAHMRLQETAGDYQQHSAHMRLQEGVCVCS